MTEQTARKHTHCWNHTKMVNVGGNSISDFCFVRWEWCCRCGIQRERVKYRADAPCKNSGNTVGQPVMPIAPEKTP